MKTFTIDIAPALKAVTFTVKNGAHFSRSLIAGKYQTFEIGISPEDLPRVRQFAVRNGNDRGSNQGSWYAHCNGYNMDLAVMEAGKKVTLNTYRPYGRTK